MEVWGIGGEGGDVAEKSGGVVTVALDLDGGIRVGGRVGEVFGVGF